MGEETMLLRPRALSDRVRIGLMPKLSVLFLKFFVGT